MTLNQIKILKQGGVGIIPTDTVYGIVCSAFSSLALDRLFKLKGRDANKPPVVVIADIADLEKFGADITPVHLDFIKKFWPGPVTIIFKISNKFKYLDKGLGLAVRLPNDEPFRYFLRQTGPLATSSTNIQGLPPARNIYEAQGYFGDKVDFYEDGGDLYSPPSTLVDLRDGKVKILRQGSAIIDNDICKK